MWKSLFHRWHIEFGVLSKTAEGGDYVSKETTIISKSKKERYGVVFWNKGIGEFSGSIVNYMPMQPKVIHPSYTNGGVLIPRGFKLQREPETHYEGAVRILNIEDADPLGKYELDVIVDGKIIKNIQYRVKE